jgi:hypothetical protein
VGFVKDLVLPFAEGIVALERSDSGAPMKALDGSQFYHWGSIISDLRSFPDEIGDPDLVRLLVAGTDMLQTIGQAGIELPNLKGDFDKLFYTIKNDLPNLVTFQASERQSFIATVKSAATRFEHVLLASLENCPTFHVEPKKGYDTRRLVDDGLSLFPGDLAQKVPEATHDLKSAMRCVALELFTAAAFHLHRANEAVVRKYYAAVSNGAAPPGRRNPDYRPSMGDYLTELERKGWGNPQLLASLKDLKNLHRNFIAHPDMEVVDLDEIDALIGQIKTSIYHMLKVIG